MSKLDGDDDVDGSSMSASAEMFQDVRMKVLMWWQNCLINIIVS